jgi:hypothetical protein
VGYKGIVGKVAAFNLLNMLMQGMVMRLSQQFLTLRLIFVNAMSIHNYINIFLPAKMFFRIASRKKSRN